MLNKQEYSFPSFLSFSNHKCATFCNSLALSFHKGGCVWKFHQNVIIYGPTAQKILRDNQIPKCVQIIPEWEMTLRCSNYLCNITLGER